MKEGSHSERIFLIRKGRVSFYKRLPRSSYVEANCFEEHKVLELERGEVFGEDKLFFKCPNRFTAKVASQEAEIVAIKN